MERKHSSFTILFKRSLCFGLFTLICFGAFAQGNLKLKSSSGQSIPDTLLFQLQKAQAAITEINAATKTGFNAEQIHTGLAGIKQDIQPIKNDVKAPRRTVDAKTLTSYNIILKTSQQKLSGWQKDLTAASNNLQKLAREVLSLSHDSLLTVTAKDSAAKTLYYHQLVDIKLKLQNAGKSNTQSLDTVSRLLAAVSAVYLDVADLQANINQRLQSSGEHLLHKESPYIWQAPVEESEDSVAQLLSSSYAGQDKILGYFVGTTWDNRLLLIVFGVAFYLWITANFKKARRAGMREKTGELKFQYISRIPIVPALLVLLNLTPLFEPDSPAPYIELMEFISLAGLTILFWHRLPGKEFRYWLFIIALYVAIVLTSAAVHNALFMRIWFAALNLGSLYIGTQIYRKLEKAHIEKKFLKPVLIVFLVLNFLSVLLNIIGRIGLAKIYSVTAISALIQVIGLAVFIQIFSDALELQIKVSAADGGVFSRVNISRVRAIAKEALSVVAIILWSLVFLINLSISQGVFTFVHQVLSRPRAFGSVTFTLSNVLFFSVVIYVSNLFQKHIGVLFGEKSITFNNKVEHKSSKLTLVRLIIALIGVLIAVTASGIPLDKLTVVLGALSVGIGLGMQNIVNNFVSGIILIFEKPFQIGDFIELVDKKGKIQDIGIRASKMLTQQGSEVIIPNGDLLSNRFVNWTVNTAYIKSEMIFKINISADMARVTSIITDGLSKSTYVVQNIPPEILINSIAADAIELRILVWINSVYVESTFKSELFSKLVVQFATAQIKVM